MVTWSESADGVIPILGYKLYLSAGTDEYSLVYDGPTNALLREFTVNNLTTGILYQVKVAAVNFNGDSVLSDALQVYSCDFPSQPGPLYRISGTKTSILLGWTPPSDDGGCPVQGYRLLRDTGAADAISTEIDANSVKDRPTLNQYTIILPSSDTGK